MNSNSPTKRTVLKIGGMHCAGCVSAVQGRLALLDGIKKCEVNLAAENASLEFDPSSIGLDEMEKAVEGAGYHVVYEKVSMNISNMTDAGDASRLESRLRKMDGVREVQANFGTGQVQVKYNKALLSLSDLRHAISKSGYHILSEEMTMTVEEIESAKLKKLFLISLAFTLPVVILSYPDLLPFVPLAGTAQSSFLLFACASVVQFAAGRRFYAGAYRIAILGSANMDTLVATGTTAAFLFSAFNTFPSPVWHNLYYDASSVVITFILLGKYLENKTKGKTTSVIRMILEMQPRTARSIQDGKEIEVPVEAIMEGDIILVRPGEKIPIDSVVLEGSSAVDEAAITGESLPARKNPGDVVMGGTINTEGALTIRASRVGKDTVLAQIVNLVEEAISTKPPMQKMVDRVAGYFALIVMALALGTFLVWYLASPMGGHTIATALLPAVAVLVVACPCALGLATPTAVIVGMSKGAQNGVVFKDGRALESLGRIGVVVFDKTGTLTVGSPVVTDLVPLKTEQDLTPDRRLLELAALAEKNSEHPLAKAIVKKASVAGIRIQSPDEFVAIPGRGVSASHGGKQITVGSPSLMKDSGLDLKEIEDVISRFQDEGKTTVIVAVGNRPEGIIALRDAPKENAREALEAIKKAGIQVTMLTGDNERTARIVGRELGIDTVIAGVSPLQKVDVIKQFQAGPKPVAMVGDGINDAAALTQADVGIAIGSGADIAIESGNVILLGKDLTGVVAAIEISRKTVSRIRQNLFYAFSYNAILIPIAAVGLLYPALGGMAMAASSVSVTGSSLLLRRWNPPSRISKRA